MDLRPNDLPLLVSLDTLLELRNVTHAARRLHLSQPALSSQLARLRLLFKDPLLTPSETGRGMVPTPLAMDLAGPLRDAITNLSLLGTQDIPFNPLTAEANFHITGTSDALGNFAAHLVSHVGNQSNPRVRLGFVRHTDQALLEEFERGTIDVLIGHPCEFPDALRMRPLGEDRYVLAQRRNHPRGTRPPALEEYCDLQHVSPDTPHNCASAVDQHLRAAGQARQICVTVPDYAAVRDILKRTDMVATVPYSLFQGADEKDLEAVELPFEVPLQWAMAWHRRSDGDSAHRWIRDCITSVFRRTSMAIGNAAAMPAPACEVTRLALAS
jgi:DNA-binding transcriptional LysR family regulator